MYNVWKLLKGFVAFSLISYSMYVMEDTSKNPKASVDDYVYKRQK